MRIPYTSRMSPVTPPSEPTTRSRSERGVFGFWQRISEGRRIDELWSQFTADARSSYGFYIKETDSTEYESHRGFRRWYRIAKALFWALMMKLSPARRILFLVAFVLLVFAILRLNGGVNGDYTFYYFLATLLLILLLSLELADKVTMKRDLEIAREIQTWLVPTKAPEVAGGDIAFASRPQNSVAGDYYDAFYPTASASEHGKLMLVIADVAGKSIPAALLMATLQASLHTIAGEGAPLADLVMRLNRYACAHSLDGRRFTTAVLGEYDPAERRLLYANAGHNPPILRRANGDIQRLEASGLPLGIEMDATYPTSSVGLKPGDALILYTDGVVEAFNEKGEEFGNERWLGAINALPDLGAPESLQFLMKRVDDFVGFTRQSDDITCLVFRCK
ncbi:MAG TPA: PP2C family protein-serine/threonine phosphatase [Candidatus Solibacter sp.]|nr:PP2C family protein-serine/threonine phosphatase [Candidatus Solibacter sp.]